MSARYPRVFLWVLGGQAGRKGVHQPPVAEVHPRAVDANQGQVVLRRGQIGVGHVPSLVVAVYDPPRS